MARRSRNSKTNPLTSMTFDQTAMAKYLRDDFKKGYLDDSLYGHLTDGFLELSDKETTKDVWAWEENWRGNPREYVDYEGIYFNVNGLTLHTWSQKFMEFVLPHIEKLIPEYLWWMMDDRNDSGFWSWVGYETELLNKWADSAEMKETRTKFVAEVHAQAKTWAASPAGQTTVQSKQITDLQKKAADLGFVLVKANALPAPVKAKTKGVKAKLSKGAKKMMAALAST